VVAKIVKQYALAAGLDPAELSGHSLRAGFVTSAAETGASILKIQETRRHKSVDVLAAYVRRVDLFKDRGRVSVIHTHQVAGELAERHSQLGDRGGRRRMATSVRTSKCSLATP
jgi:hypothetical protein